MSESIETISGETSTTTYTYSEGRLETKVNDDISYEYEYNNDNKRVNLIKYKTTVGMLGFDDLYEPLVENADGNIERYKRFGYLTTKKHNRLGLESEVKTGGVHNLKYTYDYYSQNLIKKFDKISNKGEEFDYNATYDQLTSSKVYSHISYYEGIAPPAGTLLYASSEELTYDIAYDEAETANIVSKTDVGMYSYGNANPHQLSSISQPSTIAPEHQLSVHQLSSSVNDKPLSIKSSATNAGSGMFFTFSLGLSDHRIETERYSNYSSNINTATHEDTRRYFNDYEELITYDEQNNEEHKYTIRYIGFGDGTEFIFKKEENDAAWTKYLAHTDYQGTILKLSLDASTSLFEQNFDAWGRRRYHSTWTFDETESPLTNYYSDGSAFEGDDDDDFASIAFDGESNDDQSDIYNTFAVADQTNLSLVSEEPATTAPTNQANVPINTSFSSDLETLDNDNIGLWFNRGYTGHEHLKGTKVIHMNARLYDSHTARFLSADKIIADRENSENYNRYAYALNNPTKYIDPSGNLVTLTAAIIIGATIAAITYTAVIATSDGGFRNWNWDDFAISVGFGALSGAVTYGIGCVEVNLVVKALMHGVASVATTSLQSWASNQVIKGENLLRSFATSALASMASSGAKVFAE
ncbi:MAG: RHS repeat-associated core domain-containing protein, partial [Flavobacteriales bacterium]